MRKFFAFILLFALVICLASFGTAHAWIKTVTFALTDDNTFTATGDINAAYNVNLSALMGRQTVSWTMGDLGFTWTSDKTGFYVRSSPFAGMGHIFGGFVGVDNWTFTISNSNNYYIDNVKYYDNRNELCAELNNETASCTITKDGSIHAFTVTYSDVPAYKINYEMYDEEYIPSEYKKKNVYDDHKFAGNGHNWHKRGTNAAENPEFYEQGTTVTLANPTREFYTKGQEDNHGCKKGKDIFDDVYDFGGWYDNAELNGSPITEISAGETGIKTLYAKWTAKEWTITNTHTGSTIIYTIETKPFELYSPALDGYEFMGWYDNEDFAGYKIRTITTRSGRRDITLYAKWHNPHENPDGSIYNPYKIANESDLRDLAAKVNSGEDVTGKYYEQTADITITGGDWTPIGTNVHEFNGNYDGGGFTISGINIDSTNDYQGLFGSVRGTSNEKRGFIQNIVLTDSSIKGGSYIGGIVGRLGFGHVKNCHVRSSVTVTTTSGKSNVGGIVGYFYGGKVSGCTSMALVAKKGTNVGAVIGYADFENDDDKISDCFSYGPSTFTTDSIGKTFSAQGRVTNVERVYYVRNTDGIVILPEEVSNTDGFMLNNISYYKSGAKVSLSVSADQYEGYEFEVSYDTGSSLTVVPRKDDGQYILTVPEKNVKLTAARTPITYGIYYELDGGTLETANPESYTVESEAITLNNPTRENYTFAGWLEGDGETAKTTVTIAKGSTGMREYVATWTPISYSITYDLDGGTVATANPTSYTIESSTITLNNPTKTGYTFTGWTGTGLNQATITVEIAKGSTGVRSYTANWTANQYTLTFDTQAGLMISDKATANYGDTVTLTVKAGYEANNVSVKNGSTSITVTDNGNGTYSFTMPAGAVTVEAEVTPITYAITYELDGGTVATANPTSYTIETEKFTLNNPTKDGSTFAGWTGTGLSGATMTVEIAQGSTGARTYTATWTGGGSEAETNAPSFKTYQLKLEGRIEVIFYADIPEKFRNSDTIVIFDVSGDKSNNNPRVFDEDFKNDSGSYYGFKCEITSVQMADVITATLNYKDGNETKTTTLKCRAKDYLDYGIEHETDTTTRELLKAIKDYGHYVQPSLAQENGWTVGKEHAEMDCATDETTFDGYISGAQSDVSANYAAEISSNTAGITTTYQLDLKSDTEIYVYVSPASSVSATYLDGSEYSVIQDGRYCVNISGVSAHLLGSPYTVTVKYGDSKEFDIKISALSYVNTVLSNSSDSVIRRAVTSLYRYYTATKAYRQAHGYND